MWKEYLQNVQERAPLVHCITNVVTVNDCANIILAVGGAPTMAQHVGEAAEIAGIASGLVLNMGNVSATESMIQAGRAANICARPIILDPVGVSSSHLRQDTCRRLCDNMHLSVVRGNATEIRYLATGIGNASGVDAAAEDKITEENVVSFAKLAMAVATRLNCVVAISGVIDIAADAHRAYAIHGGCREMSRITGSGCMLTAMMGAFIGANPDHILEAVVTAQAVMKISGNIAKEKTDAVDGGTMTFRLQLMDAVSRMTGEILEERAHVEELTLCDL